MYNTGARASELMGLTRGQVMFGSTALVQLHGKGRKDRTVPLWPQTAKVLARWFEILNTDEKGLAFPAKSGARLSADALNRLLQGAVLRAATACPDLANKRVTPHVFRHTTAMHLLQAGVDIAVIALWLGHESIETTHGYVEADLNMKQRALES
jgi:site-specific recombinase XerD